MKKTIKLKLRKPLTRPVGGKIILFEGEIEKQLRSGIVIPGVSGKKTFIVVATPKNYAFPDDFKDLVPGDVVVPYAPDGSKIGFMTHEEVDSEGKHYYMFMYENELTGIIKYKDHEFDITWGEKNEIIKEKK